MLIKTVLFLKNVGILLICFGILHFWRYIKNSDTVFLSDAVYNGLLGLLYFFSIHLLDKTDKKWVIFLHLLLTAIGLIYGLRMGRGLNIAFLLVEIVIINGLMKKNK